MTRDEFDVLIQRLEGISKKRPVAYAMRIVGLVMLAYGYLGMILFGTLVACIVILIIVFKAPNAATIKLGFIGIAAFGGLFLTILNGLWVTLTPPKGELLRPEQAPRLFALLEELRTKLKCRPFHQVLVINDLNAAVVQIPRLGIFGWHRNYLLIGLPLMQCLSPDELKSVLAHEFAHSSRGHGRFGNWLYRVRRSWEQIFAQMGRQNKISRAVLMEFVDWYWPLFNGHAFVLARANEYEADACSVRLTSADTAANALMHLRVNSGLMSEKFWPDIYARATETETPPPDVMGALQRSFKSGPTPDDAKRWLRQSFLAETNNSDTHPCLKDRLRAMGRLPAGLERDEIPAPPHIPAESAAEYYLGEYLNVLSEKLSADWQKNIQAQWKAQCERAQKLNSELTDLDKKASETPSNVDVLWEKASKLFNIHGDKAALPVLEQILAVDPQHPAANFVMGRHLLSMDNERGAELIEKAIDFDPMLTGDGCNLLFGYFTRSGQRDKLRPLELRVDQFKEQLDLARQERARINGADTFIPHELTDTQVADAQKVFATEPNVKLAAIARKQLKHFPKRPCFVVAVHLDGAFLNMTGSDVVKRLADKLKLPGNFLVFMDAKNMMPVADKVFKVPGASIYRR